MDSFKTDICVYVDKSVDLVDFFGESPAKNDSRIKLSTESLSE